MEHLSDDEIAREYQDLVSLRESPGWRRLRQLADEKLEAIKHALIKADPTNSAQVASLQAQARECGYFFALVEERIQKGKAAMDRIARREG